jgi:hypothetical protein
MRAMLSSIQVQMEIKNKIEVIYGDTIQDGSFMFKVSESSRIIPRVNNSKYHSLKEWQVEAVTQLTNEKYFIIQAPTGAGKSYGLCSLAYEKIKNDRQLKVVFAVPQTIIASGFVDKTFVSAFGDKVDFNPHANLCSDYTNEGTVRDFLGFLGNTAPVSVGMESQNVVICTHATLVAAFKANRSLFNNVLVVVDEAHHVRNEIVYTDLEDDGELESENEFDEDDENQELIWNGLGEIVSYALENDNQDKNFQIGLTTATFFRSDSASVVPAGTKDDKFSTFFLPFDKFFNSLTHLCSLSFNSVFYSKDYWRQIDECIKTQGEFKKSIFFIPSVMSRSSSGKKNDVLNIIKGISGKQFIVEDIDYQFLNESLKKTTYDNHIYISITRNGETLRFVDFVSEPNRKEKKKIINDSHDAELEENIHGIIALGVFKEGASWKWAENCYIIGERRSLVELVQINGRLYRDVAGKESVSTFYFVDRYFDPTSTEDEFLERSNTTFKTVFVSMMIEEILMPPCKITRRTNVVNKITGALEEVVKEYHPILELAGSHDKAIALKKNIIDTFNELSVKELTSGEIKNGGEAVSRKIQDLVKKAIIINLEKNKTYAEESIEDAVKEIYDFTAKRNNAIKNTKPKEALKEPMFDVNDINFDIMHKTPLGLWFACSSGEMAVNDFENLRAAICSGIDAGIEKIEEINDFFNVHKKYPSRTVKDNQELRIGSWLANKRNSKNGKGSGRFYNEYQSHAEKLGHPNMFDSINDYRKNLEKIEWICEYYKSFGVYPSTISAEKETRKMGRWLSNIKKRIKIDKFYNEYQIHAEKLGHPNMLGSCFSLEKQKEKLNEIYEFFKLNNRYPSVKNHEEGGMANWIYATRAAKSGKGTGKFYPELEPMAETLGMHNLFSLNDLDSRQQKQIDVLNEYIKFCNDNNKKPSEVGDENEIKLARWISKIRGAKAGINNNTWYPILEKIADQNGFEGLFQKNSESQVETQLKMLVKVNDFYKKMAYQKKNEGCQSMKKNHCIIGLVIRRNVLENLVI